MFNKFKRATNYLNLARSSSYSNNFYYDSKPYAAGIAGVAVTLGYVLSLKNNAEAEGESEF